MNIRQRQDQPFQNVRPLPRLLQPECRPPPDHFHPVVDIKLYHFLQSQRPRLPVHQRNVDDRKRILELRVLVQLVDHHVRVRIPLQFHHDAHRVLAVRLIAHIRNVLDLVILHALGNLLHQYGWHQIAAGKPAYASGDLHLDYTLGFEILVATVLSWWPYMGGVMRMSKSIKQALFPSMICLGMITGVIGLIGLYASLATGNADPSISFVKITGLWMGIVAVVFIALANIGTAIVGVYATAIGLKQIPTLQYRLGWKSTAAIVLAPVAIIAAFFPSPFMAHILTFMYFLGLVFAPICGVQIVDYYFFRRQKLDVRSLYDYTSSSKYHFWGGFNPAGFIATAVGCVIYYWLLNPVTYAQHFPFKWISASIPTVFVAGAVYWVVTRLVVIPARKGGYERYHDAAAVQPATSAEPAGLGE